MNKFNQILARAFFPLDYLNLKQSEYARGKKIILDTMLKDMFVERCRNTIRNTDQSIYGNIDPFKILDSLEYRSLEDITLKGLKREKILWITVGTQFGTPADYERYKPFFKHMDTIAIVCFSALSAGYSGISVFKVVKGTRKDHLECFWRGIKVKPMEPDEIDCGSNILVIRNEPFYRLYRGNIMKFFGLHKAKYNDDIIVFQNNFEDMGKLIYEIVNAGLQPEEDYVFIDINSRIKEGINEDYPVKLPVDWLEGRFSPLSGKVLIRYCEEPHVERTCEGWTEDI